MPKKLTGVDEDCIHVEFSAEGAEDEATGRAEHKGRKEDSCTETNFSVNVWFEFVHLPLSEIQLHH